MKTRFLGVVAAGLLIATSACAGKSPSASSQTSPSGDARVGNAIVFSGADLATAGGALLDALISRVGNMRIERRPGRCPDINIRGQRTIVNATYPLVYVDGTRFHDTCILDQIRVLEVERVEIYASGFTPRSGYRTSPYGLILVFLTGGE